MREESRPGRHLRGDDNQVHQSALIIKGWRDGYPGHAFLHHRPDITRNRRKMKRTASLHTLQHGIDRVRISPPREPISRGLGEKLFLSKDESLLADLHQRILSLKSYTPSFVTLGYESEPDDHHSDHPRDRIPDHNLVKYSRVVGPAAPAFPSSHIIHFIQKKVCAK